MYIVYLFVQFFWYFVLNTLWSIVFINMPTDVPTVSNWTPEAFEVAATNSMYNVYNMLTFCECFEQSKSD